MREISYRDNGAGKWIAQLDSRDMGSVEVSRLLMKSDGTIVGDGFFGKDNEGRYSTCFDSADEVAVWLLIQDRKILADKVAAASTESAIGAEFLAQMKSFPSAYNAMLIEMVRCEGKIQAIKMHRLITGKGLKEAKDEVEALMDGVHLALIR